MRAFIYKNLTASRQNDKTVYSIRVKGKVIAHATVVFLSNVRYKVSEAGRQRVLKTGHKNVHAGVEGDLVSYRRVDDESIHVLYDYNSMKDLQRGGLEVTYNPRKGPSFVYRHWCDSDINHSTCCILNQRGVFAPISSLIPPQGSLIAVPSILVVSAAKLGVSAPI